MTTQKILKILSEREVAKLSLIENRFHKAIMTFLKNTGLRVSELVSLNIEHVVSENNKLKNEIVVVGKGSKQRSIPLNKHAKSALRVLIKDCKNKLKKTCDTHSPLIVSQKRCRMHRVHINRIVRKYRNELKLNTQMTPHTFRHCFATLLIKKGVNFKTVQTLLGHSSISTTLDIYTHTTNLDMRAAVDKL